MSSIIRARNGDMVVSFRWWSAEQSPARRHQQNTPIRHHPDFTTPALGDSRSVQPQFSVKAVDRDRVEIDRADFSKAYDIDIHAEDVAISEEKRKFEFEAERTLAVIRKVADPDTNPS